MRWLRVPFLLAYGGMCQGLKSSQKKTEADVVIAFAAKVAEFAAQHGFSTRNPQKAVAMSPLVQEDKTFDINNEPIERRHA